MARNVTSVSMQVTGLKEALREINSIDVRARRQITKDYAQIVSTVITQGQQNTPEEPPIRGMKWQWKARKVSQIFPWNNAASDRTMKPFVSGKRPRQYGAFTSDLAVFGIRWSASDALTVEMAGKGPVPTARGKQMVAALNAKYGTPGRFLWKAFEQHQDKVIAEVEELVKRVMRMVQKDL